MMTSVLAEAKNHKALAQPCAHKIVRDWRFDRKCRTATEIRCQECGRTWPDFEAWIFQNVDCKDETIITNHRGA